MKDLKYGKKDWGSAWDEIWSEPCAKKMILPVSRNIYFETEGDDVTGCNDHDGEYIHCILQLKGLSLNTMDSTKPMNQRGRTVYHQCRSRRYRKPGLGPGCFTGCTHTVLAKQAGFSYDTVELQYGEVGRYQKVQASKYSGDFAYGYLKAEKTG